MAGDSTIEVHIVPGARKNEIAGWHDGRLKLKIKAPPVEGKANEEVCRYLAELLGLRSSAVSLKSGGKSRHKIFHVRGISAEELALKLELLGSQRPE